jgi:hypothetical protein
MLFWMRSRSQILAFLNQNFDPDACPSPLREFAREYIGIPWFQNQAPKLQLVRFIFSHPQLAAITRRSQEITAAFRKVSDLLCLTSRLIAIVPMIFRAFRTVVNVLSSLTSAGSNFSNGCMRQIFGCLASLSRKRKGKLF